MIWFWKRATHLVWLAILHILPKQTFPSSQQIQRLLRHKCGSTPSGTLWTKSWIVLAFLHTMSFACNLGEFFSKIDLKSVVALLIYVGLGPQQRNARRKPTDPPCQKWTTSLQLSGDWLPTATAHPPALALARWEGWLYQQPPQRAAVITQHAMNLVMLCSTKLKLHCLRNCLQLFKKTLKRAKHWTNYQ